MSYHQRPCMPCPTTSDHAVLSYHHRPCHVLPPATIPCPTTSDHVMSYHVPATTHAISYHQQPCSPVLPPSTIPCPTTSDHVMSYHVPATMHAMSYHQQPCNPVLPPSTMSCPFVPPVHHHTCVVVIRVTDAPLPTRHALSLSCIAGKDAIAPFVTVLHRYRPAPSCTILPSLSPAPPPLGIAARGHPYITSSRRGEGGYLIDDD